MIKFTVQKTKLLDKVKDNINPRQHEVVIRILKEGLEGFKGGLSADNYISITKASRATVTRDLSDLVAKQIFFKKGSLRYARYFLNLENKF